MSGIVLVVQPPVIFGGDSPYTDEVTLMRLTSDHLCDVSQYDILCSFVKFLWSWSGIIWAMKNSCVGCISQEQCQLCWPSLAVSAIWSLFAIFAICVQLVMIPIIAQHKSNIPNKLCCSVVHTSRILSCTVRTSPDILLDEISSDKIVPRAEILWTCQACLKMQSLVVDLFFVANIS